jgi:hypothetical protein
MDATAVKFPPIRRWFLISRNSPIWLGVDLTQIKSELIALERMAHMLLKAGLIAGKVMVMDMYWFQKIRTGIRETKKMFSSVSAAGY